MVPKILFFGFLFILLLVILDISYNILKIQVEKYKIKRKMKKLKEQKIGIDLIEFLTSPCLDLRKEINSLTLKNSSFYIYIDDSSVINTDIKESSIKYVMFNFRHKDSIIVPVIVDKNEVIINYTNRLPTIEKSTKDNISINSNVDRMYYTQNLATTIIGFIYHEINTNNYSFLYKKKNDTYGIVRPNKKRVCKYYLQDIAIKSKLINLNKYNNFIEFINKKLSSLYNIRLAEAFDYLNHKGLLNNRNKELYDSFAAFRNYFYVNNNSIKYISSTYNCEVKIKGSKENSYNLLKKKNILKKVKNTSNYFDILHSPEPVTEPELSSSETF